MLKARRSRKSCARAPYAKTEGQQQLTGRDGSLGICNLNNTLNFNTRPILKWVRYGYRQPCTAIKMFTPPTLPAPFIPLHQPAPRDISGWKPIQLTNCSICSKSVYSHGKENSSSVYRSWVTFQRRRRSVSYCPSHLTLWYRRTHQPITAPD
jgi:hypothetical protein